MSRAPYAPSPGSVAQRAIAHLETLPARTDLSTAALAEAIGVPPNNLRACLEAPAKAGLIFGRQKYAAPRAPFFWSLAPVARETNDFDPAPDAQASGSQTPEGADSEGRVEAGSNTEGQRSQHVVKAEAPAKAEPDATDREIAATASPVGGPTGARQPAAADPAGEPLVGTNASMSLSGEIAIVAECGTVVLFDRERARQLVAFLVGRVA
jgi:hypothetical protein